MARIGRITLRQIHGVGRHRFLWKLGRLGQLKFKFNPPHGGDKNKGGVISRLNPVLDQVAALLENLVFLNAVICGFFGARQIRLHFPVRSKTEEGAG